MCARSIDKRQSPSPLRKNDLRSGVQDVKDVSHVRPEYVANLNNDIISPDDCFEKLVERYA